MERGNENRCISPKISICVQANIGTFSLSILKDIAYTYPFSEEQANVMYDRELNGPRRQLTLRLFIDHMSKDAKMKRLLDPKVSVCCLLVRLFFGLSILVHIYNNS